MIHENKRFRRGLGDRPNAVARNEFVEAGAEVGIVTRAPVKGPGAFADDAAKLIEESARRRRLDPNSGILNMARKLDIKAIDRIAKDLGLSKD
jgi:hypothetical protein